MDPSLSLVGRTIFDVQYIRAPTRKGTLDHNLNGPNFKIHTNTAAAAAATVGEVRIGPKEKCSPSHPHSDPE